MAPAPPLQPRLQLDVFEGPLDLLLTLIEQRRLPITQVSLAQVADQYLAQVRSLPALNADLLADFLAIAGKLLLLKSRALLLTDEPDPVAEETAADLEQRLAEYRLFRAAAERLQALEQAGQRTHPTLREPASASALPAPLAPIAPDALLAAMRRVLARQQAGPAPATLALRPRASVDERRAWILDALRERPHLAFSEVAGHTVDEVVAAFLAILELFRRGQIGLAQAAPFDDLTISRVA